MIIKVLFFAQLKDAFGTSGRTVEIQEGRTVGEFVRLLFREAGASGLKDLPLLFAINEEFVNEDRELEDKDVLALLPPVAGG